MKKLTWIQWEIPVGVLTAATVLILIAQVESGAAISLRLTRPIAILSAILLGVLAAIYTQQGMAAYQRYHRQLALKISLRMVSWLISLVALLIIPLLFLIDAQGSLWADKTRIIEIFIPLAMGIQAALMFSPEDEATLEVTLSYPRPAYWLIMERLAIGLCLQSAVAMIGLALTFASVDDIAPLTELLRWLPPLVFFAGVGLYATLRSRVAVFGVVVTILLWGAFLVFGKQFLPGAGGISILRYVQPFFWAVHPYLEPGDLGQGDYWLNRVLVFLIGFHLIRLAILQLRSEELILLGTERKSA